MAIATKLCAFPALGLVLALIAPQVAQATVGLNGAYYQLLGRPGSLAGAASAISGQSADASFIATSICFPNCGGTIGDASSLGDFLGGNATDISANSIANLSNHVLTLTGFLNIAAAGTYRFALGSDDGSQLSIDGILLSNDGDHGFGTVSKDYTLDAGLHAISILQFEDGGAAGMSLRMDDQPLGTDILQTDTAGAVPEPASWALMIGGFALVGAAMRRRRRSVASEAA